MIISESTQTWSNQVCSMIQCSIFHKFMNCFKVEQKWVVRYVSCTYLPLHWHLLISMQWGVNEPALKINNIWSRAQVTSKLQQTNGNEMSTGFSGLYNSQHNQNLPNYESQPVSSNEQIASSSSAASPSTWHRVNQPIANPKPIETIPAQPPSIVAHLPEEREVRELTATKWNFFLPYGTMLTYHLIDSMLD